MSLRAYLALGALVVLLAVCGLSVATGDAVYAVATGIAALLVLFCLVRMDRTR